MRQVSISELDGNLARYVELAQEQDVLITSNGKVVAKLVTAKVDKVTAAKELFRMLPKNVPVDLEKARKERIMG